MISLLANFTLVSIIHLCITKDTLVVQEIPTSGCHGHIKYGLT